MVGHAGEAVGYRRTVRRPRGAWRLTTAVAAAAVAGGCELPDFGAPDAKSDQGESILSLWQGFFVAAIGVGLLVWGLVIWCILRYRRRHDDEMPNQKAYNIPMEILYTLSLIHI